MYLAELRASKVRPSLSAGSLSNTEGRGDPWKLSAEAGRRAAPSTLAVPK